MTNQHPNSNDAPPVEYGFNYAFGVAFRLFVGFGFAAFFIFLLGEGLLGASGLNWISRVVAGLVGLFGLIAWAQPLKVVHLKGEDDEWHILKGWDGRIIALIPGGGVRRITPLQETIYWRRVNPIMVKMDTLAHNRHYDKFEIHVRVLFEFDFEYVYGSKNFRWVQENYPDNIKATAEGILANIVSEHMKQVQSFNLAVEEETEANIKAAIHQKFSMWEDYGVFINENVTFVDVMIPQEVWEQRTSIRAELSVLQIIREVAHDMGINTNELLIQRTLERLPHAKTRQNVGEIAAVLQMLHSQSIQQLESGTYEDDLPTEPQIRVEEPVRPAPEAEVIDEEPPINPDDTTPTAYVEGVYEPIDDIDPDADGGGTIYSPF